MRFSFTEFFSYIKDLEVVNLSSAYNTIFGTSVIFYIYYAILLFIFLLAIVRLIKEENRELKPRPFIGILSLFAVIFFSFKQMGSIINYYNHNKNLSDWNKIWVPLIIFVVTLFIIGFKLSISFFKSTSYYVKQIEVRKKIDTKSNYTYKARTLNHEEVIEDIFNSLISK